MAYYEDSVYLDQTRNLYEVSYTSLLGSQQISTELDDQNAEEGTKPKIDFSTNAYLFFKEKEYIRDDTLNICEFIRLKYIEDIEQKWLDAESNPEISPDLKQSIFSKYESFKKFPVEVVSVRIANILQKYHEKPNLLAKASEFIIKQVMDVTKECLHMITKMKAEMIKN